MGTWFERNVTDVAAHARAQVEGVGTVWKHEVIASGKYGTAYYFAVRATPIGEIPEGDIMDTLYERDTNGSFVYASIVKIVRSDGMIGTKVMDETSHPYYYDAPLGVTKLLSKLKDVPETKMARDWRKLVVENRNKAASSARIDNGTILKFKEPLSFGSYGEARYFTVNKVGRSVTFWALTDQGAPRFQCRITNWRKRDFEVMPNTCFVEAKMAA